MHPGDKGANIKKETINANQIGSLIFRRPFQALIDVGFSSSNEKNQLPNWVFFFWVDQLEDDVLINFGGFHNLSQSTLNI